MRSLLPHSWVGETTNTGGLPHTGNGFGLRAGDVKRVIHVFLFWN